MGAQIKRWHTFNNNSRHSTCPPPTHAIMTAARDRVTYVGSTGIFTMIIIWRTNSKCGKIHTSSFGSQDETWRETIFKNIRWRQGQTCYNTAFCRRKNEAGYKVETKAKGGGLSAHSSHTAGLLAPFSSVKLCAKNDTRPRTDGLLAPIVGTRAHKGIMDSKWTKAWAWSLVACELWKWHPRNFLIDHLITSRDKHQLQGIFFGVSNSQLNNDIDNELAIWCKTKKYRFHRGQWPQVPKAQFYMFF